MYFYESDSARCWRPDLVPAILKWIDGIPPESLPRLTALHVNEDGSFGASFRKRADGGGPPREVRVEFDHGGSSLHVVCNDGSLVIVGMETEIVPFDAAHLTLAANAAE